MTSNKTVTVSFEEISSSQSYELVTAVQGGGGAILPPSGTYDEGTVVKLIASPNPGYHVALWSGTDNDSLTSEINFATMDSSKTVMVMFNESAPVIESFTAIPNMINQGEVTVLSWNITGVDSANIDNGIGSVDRPAGSASVSPDTTTIYTLTATNSWGSVSASVSVTVKENPVEQDNDSEKPNSEDPDSDNDGLPDIWEEAYGMDPMDAMGVNGKNGDFDGDGWSNYEEYENQTNPADNASVPLLDEIRILETIPQHGAGENDDFRVTNDTSFSVRIEALNGIDVTNPGSVRFTIDDGGFADYMRDLSDTQVVRVINLSGEPDTNVKELWVSYYRSAESRSYSSKTYAFDTPITIKVDIEDRIGVQMKQAVFRARIETQEAHDAAQEPVDFPKISAIDPEDPELEAEYDAGIQVDSGDLSGAKIIYSSDEPLLPTFEFSNELPPVDVEDLKGVGMPLVLQPHTVFSTPVKIFIPCPEYSDLSELCVVFYNGDEWVAACDENGDILPGGEGWMVPGSRVNRDNDDPPTIEIQVYHFSAVQAAGNVSKTSIAGDEQDMLAEVVDEAEKVVTGVSGASGSGCFIGTATRSTSDKGLHTDQRDENSILSITSILVAISAPMLMGRLGPVLFPRPYGHPFVAQTTRVRPKAGSHSICNLFTRSFSKAPFSKPDLGHIGVRYMISSSRIQCFPY
jgi:hypothetical protein